MSPPLGRAEHNAHGRAMLRHVGVRAGRRQERAGFGVVGVEIGSRKIYARPELYPGGIVAICERWGVS